eukprot:Skav207077  [mRNA]  locus=scaffold1909:466964:476771:+ [translate_table: standard]
MSTCPHCSTFVGAPTCVACRTYFRVGAILQSGRLSAFNEAQVVSALRNCSGALSDLAEGEVAGPFGPGTSLKPEARAEEEGRWPIEKKEEPNKEKASPRAGEKKGSDKEKGESSKAAKKESKHRAKGKEKSKEKKKRTSPSGEEEPPEAESSRGVRLEEKRDKAKVKTGEDIRKEKAKPLPRQDSESGESEEEIEEEAEEEDLQGLGLSRIPIRGTAAKHFDDNKAKAKGAAVPRPKVKAKAKAKGRAGGAVHRRPGAAPGVVPGRLRLRRPASRRDGAGDPGEDLRASWEAGHTVRSQDIALDWLLRAREIVFEEATYFHGETKLAGKLISAHPEAGEVYLRLQPTGTSSENILKLCTANPGKQLRVHLCGRECNKEETAEDLVHGTKLRLMRDEKAEEAWTGNLEAVRPAAAIDELAQLREKFEEGGKEKKDSKRSRSRQKNKKEKKSKGKEKKEKGKDKERDKEKESKAKEKKVEKKSDSESSDGIALDGTQPRRAALKNRSDLFGGTGMDPNDRVKAKVARAARSFARRRSKRKSSSSRSSGSDSDGGDFQDLDDALFSESTKVRGVAEGFPGALCHKALSAMQDHLLQSVGFEEQRSHGSGIAVQYFRQVLQKKASGAVGRELLTLAASIDLICRGRPTQSLDLMIQRYKSIESTLSGMPWQVSQKVELLPPEVPSISELTEMKDARKEVAEEQKTRWASGYNDGRNFTKGGGRGKTRDEGPQRPRDAEIAGAASPDQLGAEPRDEAERTEEKTSPTNRKGDVRTQDGKQGSREVPGSHQKSPGWLRSQPPNFPVQSAQSVPEKATATPAGPSGLAGILHCAPAAPFANSGEKERRQSGSLVGLTLSGCGEPLLQRILEGFPLRSQHTGKVDKCALYPLPTSRDVFATFDPSLDSGMIAWMVCVCICLNSFWGGDLFSDVIRNDGQRECLEGIAKDVKRFCSISMTLPMVDWGDVMKTKNIDYKGDEVKVARWFQWSNVSPALPAEVGCVPLAEVCERGCRDYVLNFEDYLKPESEWVRFKPPRVMVADEDWGDVCDGLVQQGVCTYIAEEDVFHTPSGPLLNGLFGVSKEEWTSSGTEVFRLIMNLIPLNGLCRPISGDVDTLPAWSSMNPYFLQPSECLLVSSEDIRCFFYTMSLPASWVKFLAFNKPVPHERVPESMKGSTVYLASLVLPMGFLNSVSLAQHVHRTLVRWSGDNGAFFGSNPPEGELRKDRSLPSTSSSWRVYLDNFDVLEKVKATNMVELEGSYPEGLLALRQEYERWEVPRNIKKSVQRSGHCELQGATVDGHEGVAYPRESKLGKYFSLAFSLCGLDHAVQKQWQIACGGLVYFSMFRRPLLGSLNKVWQHIESFNTGFARHQATPDECKVEVLRFLGLLPLARMDFRLDMNSTVTCSDASTLGGGICESAALTQAGAMVAQGGLRGDVPESRYEFCVLSVSLFDGIGALRVALDLVGVPVLGHVSVEVNPNAQRVVEAHFPGSVCISKVEEVTEEVVRGLACRFSQCALVLLGAGPPCQDVSGLNSERKGVLRGERSSLFLHVPRVEGLLRKHFKWCPTHVIMESVASMDSSDRQVMSDGFGSEPVACDAGCFTLCHRPRLYWLTWELLAGEDVAITQDGPLWRVVFNGQQDPNEVLRKGELRLPDISERECMLGFPVGFTLPCVNKSSRNTEEHSDIRKTLLGNTWSVPVVAVLLGHLFHQLGWISQLTPQEVLRRCQSGQHSLVQGRLLRLPLNPCRGPSTADPYQLAFKLGNLVSIKGEDVLLCTPSSQLVKYHRLRASVPSRLWKWRIVSGWRWVYPGEHINALELRAVLASLRYRLEHRLQFSCRMIHLVDSLVCLHALARGRSSSRRLRRTLARVNALILAGNVQPDRAAQRRKLGSLRDLTVQPATKRRYNLATEAFFTYLRSAGLTLPKEKHTMDALLCDFLEHLWSSGAGRAQACDTLAGVQDIQPGLRNHLPGAWRLLRTWSVNEIPCRAPPLPEHIVTAMAGWSFFKGHYSFGISLLVGFYSMLRTGEILNLRSSHMLSGPQDKQIVISLGLTKAGKRQGAAESVILGYAPAVKLAKKWKSLATVSRYIMAPGAQSLRHYSGCSLATVAAWAYADPVQRAAADAPGEELVVEAPWRRQNW